jgi:uncharacterized membrane protein
MPYRLLTVFILSGIVTSALAQTFEVAKVDRTHHLNIRADIDQTTRASEAKVIGQIGYGATGILTTGISFELNGARWRQIYYKGIIGWVNSNYLRQIGAVEAAESLDCSGTEPFWVLTIRKDRVQLHEVSSDSVTKLTVAEKRQGENRSGLWSVRLATQNNKSSVTALIVFTDRCSAGTGDLQYAFEIYLLGLRPQYGPVQGCCSFGPR